MIVLSDINYISRFHSGFSLCVLTWADRSCCADGSVLPHLVVPGLTNHSVLKDSQPARILATLLLRLQSQLMIQATSNQIYDYRLKLTWLN